MLFTYDTIRSTLDFPGVFSLIPGAKWGIPRWLASYQHHSPIGSPAFWNGWTKILRALGRNITWQHKVMLILGKEPGFAKGSCYRYDSAKPSTKLPRSEIFQLFGNHVLSGYPHISYIYIQYISTYPPWFLGASQCYPFFLGASYSHPIHGYGVPAASGEAPTVPGLSHRSDWSQLNSPFHWRCSNCPWIC